MPDQIRTTQPVTDLPDLDDLPKKVHETARKWHELDEQFDALDIEVQRLEVIGIPGAIAQDERDLHAAIETGAVLPDGDENQREAERAHRTAIARRDATGHALARAGKELAEALRAHRNDIAKLHQPRIVAAHEEYVRVILDARAKVTAATAALSETLAIVGLIEDLDLGAHTDLGTVEVNLPVALSTEAGTTAVTAALALFSTPLPSAKVTVKGANGLPFEVDRDLAASLVASPNTDVKYA